MYQNDTCTVGYPVFTITKDRPGERSEWNVRLRSRSVAVQTKSVSVTQKKRENIHLRNIVLKHLLPEKFHGLYYVVVDGRS